MIIHALKAFVNPIRLAYWIIRNPLQYHKLAVCNDKLPNYLPGVLLVISISIGAFLFYTPWSFSRLEYFIKDLVWDDPILFPFLAIYSLSLLYVAAYSIGFISVLIWRNFSIYSVKNVVFLSLIFSEFLSAIHRVTFGIAFSFSSYLVQNHGHGHRFDQGMTLWYIREYSYDLISLILGIIIMINIARIYENVSFYKSFLIGIFAVIIKEIVTIASTLFLNWLTSEYPITINGTTY